MFSQNPKTKRKNQNVEFIGDVLEFVKHLIQLQGNDIWLVGGSDVISLFLNENLLDEITLSIHPIVLTNGIPLFKSLQREVKLKLIKSVSYKNGLVQSRYELK